MSISALPGRRPRLADRSPATWIYHSHQKDRPARWCRSASGPVLQPGAARATLYLYCCGGKYPGLESHSHPRPQRYKRSLFLLVDFRREARKMANASEGPSGRFCNPSLLCSLLFRPSYRCVIDDRPDPTPHRKSGIQGDRGRGGQGHKQRSNTSVVERITKSPLHRVIIGREIHAATQEALRFPATKEGNTLPSSPAVAAASSVDSLMALGARVPLFPSSRSRRRSRDL